MSAKTRAVLALVKLLSALAITAFIVPRLVAQTPLSVSTDFEGGSARVLEVDVTTNTIRIAPGGVAERGWICWWSIRVDHTQPGQFLNVELHASEEPTRNNGHLTKKPLDANWSMPARAAFSHDGVEWLQTEPGRKQGSVIHYKIKAQSDRLWVAWGPPFTPRDTDHLISSAQSKLAGATRFELAHTREGRSVAGLRVLLKDDNASPAGVWIQARQHAWESGASWVARGLIEWLAAQDESADWLLEHAEVIVVPIMDVDNVATGNGGKEENPRDHNRDWDKAPVYPEVAAAQKHLKAWSEQKRLDVFVDLHNPGPGDRRPFFFCGPPELLSDVARDNRELFLEIASRRINGPLPIEPTPRITGPNYHPLWRQISGQWVNQHGNPWTLAVCLETAWNTPESTTTGYRTVGAQLGQTISDYLKRRATDR